MQGKYEVTYEGQAVGTVELTREGLYYRVYCRCRVPDNAIHRLYAGGEKIGVLMPDRGELVLDTKVAAKRLMDGSAFSLDESRLEFIPIRPGEPFSHLDKIREAKLLFRDGEWGMRMA